MENANKKQLFCGYSIDINGNVYNRFDEVLTPLLGPTDNYYRYELRYSRDIVRKFSLHRLMAHAYLGLDLFYTKGDLIVNHKDLNKLNNKLENLELVTHKVNIQHYVDSKQGKVGYALKDFSINESIKLTMLERYNNGEGARDLMEEFKTGQTWFKQYVIDSGVAWRGRNASRNKKVDYTPIIEQINLGLTNQQISKLLNIPRSTICNIRNKIV